MTTIHQRIKSVLEKLNSSENYDQIREMVLSLSDEEQHALSIYLNTTVNMLLSYTHLNEHTTKRYINECDFICYSGIARLH